MDVRDNFRVICVLWPVYIGVPHLGEITRLSTESLISI